MDLYYKRQPIAVQKKCSRKTFRQDRTARKGQPEKDSQDRRTGIGEIEQDNCDGQDNQEINSKNFTEYKDISTLRSLFLPVANLKRNAKFIHKKITNYTAREVF